MPKMVVGCESMKQTRHVLVVDDDRGITELLCGYLDRFGLTAHAAANGADMRRVLSSQSIDLVVMDLQLPGEDGLTLTSELRRQPLTQRIPVVMLTARGNPIDRVIGLEMGADDYLTKPFEPRELVARIQTVLRRTRGHASATLPSPNEATSDRVCFDGWQLQRDERRLLSPHGLVVPLSNAEFQLLTTFLKAPRRLLTREQLMTHARGRSLGSVERSIDLLVSRLRGKLNDNPRDPQMIKTVRGEGYVFDVPTVQWLGAQ
jgi:two-component system OmpR family response regulator